MNEKVTVTREQQDEINLVKSKGQGTLKRYITSASNWGSMCKTLLVDMTDEQIASAWLGVAEIEPEPVNPWDALKAIYEGETVHAYDIDGNCTTLSYRVDSFHFRKFHPTVVGLSTTKFYILEDE